MKQASQVNVEEELQRLQRTAAQSAAQLQWTREQLEYDFQFHLIFISIIEYITITLINYFQ